METMALDNGTVNPDKTWKIQILWTTTGHDQFGSLMEPGKQQGTNHAFGEAVTWDMWTSSGDQGSPRAGLHHWLWQLPPRISRPLSLGTRRLGR